MGGLEYILTEEDRLESIELICCVDAEEILEMFTDIHKKKKQYSKKEAKVALEIDEELGLPVVPVDTIFTKYGVPCDPEKNSFHKSLHDQFERKGYLSPKQVEALRRG